MGRWMAWLWAIAVLAGCAGDRSDGRSSGGAGTLGVGSFLPWWAWLVVAWLAADAVFVIGWTMRARIRERDEVEARFPVEPSPRLAPRDELARLDEVARRPVAANRRPTLH